MAGVDKIREKILKDCDERVNKIIEDANNQAEKILDKAKLNAQERVEVLKKKAASDVSEKKRIANSMVELEIRKDVLSTKQEMIEKIFDAVLEKLCSLSNKDYEQIVFNMLLESIETGEEEIVLSENGKLKVSTGLVDRVNQFLLSQGRTGAVTLSDETSSITGGFILKSKGLEINNSFEALIRLNRDEIEPKVAELLFDN